MAVNLAVIPPDGKPAQSNKRLFVMFLIVAFLTAWSLLKDEEVDADAIELTAQEAVPNNVSTSKNPAAAQNEYKGSSQSQQKSSASNQLTLNSIEPSVIPWQKLLREPLSSQPHNVFKVHSWLVVPKPVKTIFLPPPAPVAPPAPFTYVGKLENSPLGTQIFLLRNGHLYTAVKGQKIDAQWRLDAEDINNVQLTYLPLNLPQVLSKMAKSFEENAQPGIADTPVE